MIPTQLVKQSTSSTLYGIVNRYGLRIEVCHRNQPNKSKLAQHKPLLSLWVCLNQLYISNKTECFSYKGGWVTRKQRERMKNERTHYGIADNLLEQQICGTASICFIVRKNLSLSSSLHIILASFSWVKHVLWGAKVARCHLSMYLMINSH